MDTVKYTLSTRQFAEIAGTSMGAVRTRLAQQGNYYGIIPMKKLSGRLLWPNDSAERLQPRPRPFPYGRREVAEAA